MSTNKTQNYNLHSWVPEDEFHLAEINQNFAALDAALKSEADSLTAAVNTRCRMLTGTYKGTGDNVTQRVTVGVKPQAVLILPEQGVVLNKVSTTVPYGGMAVQGHNALGAVTLDATGFTVAKGVDGFNANATNLTYYYICLY